MVSSGGLQFVWAARGDAIEFASLFAFPQIPSSQAHYLSNSFCCLYFQNYPEAHFSGETGLPASAINRDADIKVYNLIQDG
jgi:hypothetical protein